MKIRKLPTELVIEILEYCASVSVKTLLSASQISKSFYTIFKSRRLEHKLLNIAALVEIPLELLIAASVIGSPHAPIEEAPSEEVGVARAQEYLKETLLGRTQGALIRAMKTHLALRWLVSEFMHDYTTVEALRTGREAFLREMDEEHTLSGIENFALYAAYDFAGTTTYPRRWIP